MRRMKLIGLVLCAMTVLLGDSLNASAFVTVLSPGGNSQVFSGQGIDSYDLSVDSNVAHLQYVKSTTSMQVLGFYIGGNTQADVLHRPGAGGWYRLNALKIQGWKFAPTWVGYSGTICSENSPWSAGTKGWLEGRDASERGYQAGLNPGALIYLDIENYGGQSAGGFYGPCADRMFYYISGWLQGVQQPTYSGPSYNFVGGLYAVPATIEMYRQKSIGYPGYTGPLSSIWVTKWGGVAWSQGVGRWVPTNGPVYLADATGWNGTPYETFMGTGMGDLGSFMWNQRARQMERYDNLASSPISVAAGQVVKVDANCWRGPVYPHTQYPPAPLAPNYFAHGC